MGGRRKSFYLPDRIEFGRIECMPGERWRNCAELKSCRGLAGVFKRVGSCGGLLLRNMAVFVIDTEEIEVGT